MLCDGREMSHLIWNIDELVRFASSEDAEVRFWAVDRLVRHHPVECCDAISDLLLDDHDATPAIVARHLGRHGDARHHAMLVRGFRLLRGLTPGYCLHALVRLGYPGVVELAADALKRGDLDEPALAIIIEALAEQGSPEAVELLNEYIDRKGELLAEPAALRGLIEVTPVSEIPGILERFLQALRWRGTHRAGEAFRTLMDSLRIDDAGWCFRTGPSGRIELRKTIKAVESGYDCDIIAAMGEDTLKQIAQRFRAGGLREIIRSLADWTCSAAARPKSGSENGWHQRIAEAVGAFAAQPILNEVDRLDHQFQQWLLGFQLSAAFTVARGRDTAEALREARGNLQSLLNLAEIETAHLLSELPAAIALLSREDEECAHKAQDWCLRMLEAQGPFFPKVVALEVLGELRSVHFIPEVMDYLSDENSYVYGAAERALSKMGEAIIAPAVNRIETATLDPDAAHSILVLLCDLGTRGAFEAVTRHFDWFMDSIGPGATTEWISLFGMEELIDPLRDWLEEDPAMVGQGLLLLGAIHDIPIPEEAEILQAIEDERARQAGDGGDADGPFDGNDREGGNYIM
jgi:HEAT repeat protein